VAQASTHSIPAGGVVAAGGAADTAWQATADRGARSGDSQPIRVIGSPTHRDERADDPQPSSKSRSTSTTRESRDPREPRRLPQEDDAVDIMELPPAGSRSATRQAAPTVERTSFRQAEGARIDVEQDSTSDEAADSDRSEPARVRVSQTATNRKKTASTNQASYGHDPDYAWLKGKLEYSNIDRRWKLRYIPIDGQTDSHGGSVVLPDSPLLEGFESGDFIAVQGSLAGKASSGYAPNYDLSRIKRLEP
jgi:hypothetical protein